MRAVSRIGRRVAMTAVALLVLGCATPARDPSLGTRQWIGRLALRVHGTPPQALSAAFDLRGNADTGELFLSTPLGNTLAVVRWSPAGAEVQQGGAVARRGSLDELTAELTGTSLPIAALFDWLDGRDTPAAGWQADLSERAQGRLQARRQAPEPQADLRLVLEP